MSLVLTVLVPEFVVQVSETRVSFTNRQPPRDNQRKSLVFPGERFRGLVGWVGLAVANPRHNTGDWLVDQLSTLTAKSMDAIVSTLTERATKHLATLRVLMPCEFVIAGWYATPTGAAPAHVRIKNFRRRPGHAPVVGPEFDSHLLTVSKKRPVRRPRMISVAGWEHAADDFRGQFSGLERLLKRGADAQTARDVCVDIVRRAARKYGEDTGPVGSSIIAVELPREGGAEAAFYPRDRAKPHTQYAPDLVTPTIAISRNELWYSAENTPPPWWTTPPAR